MIRLRPFGRSLLLAASLAALSALPAGASAQTRSGGAVLNYEGADLAAVARDVALRTGRVFVIDSRLSGQVNIVSPPDLQLTPDEVWQVFLTTLQVNGFAAVPIGDREYKIVQAQQSIRDGGTPMSSETGAAAVTRVIPLQYIDARSAASNLRGLIGESGFVTPIVESNAVIVVDSASNIRRIMDVVDEIDVDTSIVRRVPLNNAAAVTIANTLMELMARPATEQRASNVTVVPVDESNSIVLRGPADEINRLIPLIRDLDEEGAGQLSLDTVYLSHADAEQIVPILQAIIDSSFGEGSGAVPGSRPSIGFHKPTNALIINASPEIQRTLRGIVSRLDIRRPQVLIEAVVVEISNTTARELGVQYISGGGGIPVSAASFTGTSPNIVSAAGAAYFLGENPGQTTQTTVVVAPDGTRTETTGVVDTNNPSTAVASQLVEAAVGELLNFNGFLFGGADRNADGSVYGVLLSAIKSDSQSNVLSVPSVTLLDNETATLQVGQEIPVTTGEAVGSDFEGGFRTVERKDVGNILEVTPQINEGNSVELQIRLEVSSVGAFTSLSQDIITNKSTIETVARAENGQTLVIGGLIDNDQRDTESKVPLLGDIPLVGNLFKGQTRSREESTLMVFIRPTILRDDFTADRVTARKYDYVQQQRRKRTGNQSDRTLIDDVMLDYLGPGNYTAPDGEVTGTVPQPSPDLPGDPEADGE